MAVKNSGYEYEKKILDALKTTNIAGNIQESAGPSAAVCDADFILNGNLYNLEIKLDKNAQMGGSSIKYNSIDECFTFLDSNNINIQPLLLTALESKRTDILRLINFISLREPTYNKKIPIICTKDTWSEAQKENLLVNTKVPFDTNFISEHYRKKDVFYIQIGKAGLFYLYDNPANLPIPKLEGKVSIEIRTGRSGAKIRKTCGANMVSGGLRVQGRLKTKSKSPHTLDTIEGIQKLLEAIGANYQACSTGNDNLNSIQAVLKSTTIFVS